MVYLTPQGQVFNQELAKELAAEKDLVFLCGHYEGIDERVLEEIVTDYISIGDYVLTGGELPAMVMIDAISRMVPGVLSNEESAQFESFQDNLLEYPQYSRRRYGAGRMCRQYSYRDIMRILKNGGGSNLCSEQPSGVRIFWNMQF